MTLRHELYEQAVLENDTKIPATVAIKLGDLKAALAAAAQAAFRCAPASVTPEAMEKTLAEALGANLASAADTPIETRGKKELGAYGSDLAVQVFPLSGSPKYFQVDFRYSVACGDDNLLLVFVTGTGTGSPTTAAWQEVLRWGAPAYHDVKDAYGDFLLMTPLSGFPGQRNWRFVVAHGQPGCGTAESPSHFDLDVLEPTADPIRPTVIWHLERQYQRNQVPRLSTTEDTLTFELGPPEKLSKTAKVPAPTDTLRYRIGKDNHVEPLTASGITAPASQPLTDTHSPH